MTFEDALKAHIRARGAVSLEAFMAASVAHYYATRDPIGREGDFTTAPEISQMFGEMIAAFFVQFWLDDGCPDSVHLVEIGPGRGTLMHDLRRTIAHIAPPLERAMDIHLIEASPVLQKRQRTLLGNGPQWHTSLATVPGGYTLLVANEFLDALPIQQHVGADDVWLERSVRLNGLGGFEFFPPTMNAQIRERAPMREEFATACAARLDQNGGVALFIDYGYAKSTPGDTLQALKCHMFVDPLGEPGETDLTAHVDFESLARALNRDNTTAHGPVSQSEFLRRLGIEARARKLAEHASSPVKGEIESALKRLIDPDQMGQLFKVMACTRSERAIPPGFNDAADP